MKYEKLAGVSDEAVKKATGKDWDEWIALIDREGGARMTHKEIARMVALRLRSGHSTRLVEDHERAKRVEWWSQMVTVGYEYAQKRRVLGETVETGFEIGVTRTFPVSPDKAWKVMTSKALGLWLGDTPSIRIEKGATFETVDGLKGEIRTLKTGERVRLIYQRPGWTKPSTLQLTIVPSGSKTSIRFHQENLPYAKTREEMRRHWRQVLNRLAILVS